MWLFSFKQWKFSKGNLLSQGVHEKVYLLYNKSVPHLRRIFYEKDIDKLERFQRRGSRFIMNNYRSREEGTIHKFLCDLDLPTLQERRKELRLTFIFKIAGGLVPAINPHHYLTPIRNKRRIRTTAKLKDFITSNPVVNSQTNNSKCFKPFDSKTDIFKFSYFPRTILDWNQLEEHQVQASSPEAFRSALRGSSSSK